MILHEDLGQTASAKAVPRNRWHDPAPLGVEDPLLLAAYLEAVDNGIGAGGNSQQAGTIIFSCV